ncbi:MAG: hypothetical protein ACYC3L_14370 [Gemmatimonadaceae bacterium]
MPFTRCRAIALFAVALTFPLCANAQWVRPLSLGLNVGAGQCLGNYPQFTTVGVLAG